jgi:hypothetical protein
VGATTIPLKERQPKNLLKILGLSHLRIFLLITLELIEEYILKIILIFGVNIWHTYILLLIVAFSRSEEGRGRHLACSPSSCQHPCT